MSKRRFRPTDAFVDESIRGQRYLMGCVMAQAVDLPILRPALEELTGSKSRRLHFNAELASRRAVLLDTFATLPIRAVVVVVQSQNGVSQFEARRRCLERLVAIAQENDLERFVVESRQDDRDDERTIRAARAREPHLVFEHRRAHAEPMLWLADGVTWACGAGAKWAKRLDSVLLGVEEA